MDFSWLTNIFGSLLNKLGPLKGIKHWLIWQELKNWYTRFKKWRDWYKEHVMNPMQQMQKLQRQIYDQFFAPILKLVDHIRQLTGIIGLFNQKLANKLNFQFMRVESFLLSPFNAMTSRTNLLGGMFRSILTPLGYFDRATLLNSVWRDAGLIKETLHNPFELHPASATLPAQPTLTDRVGWTQEYIQTGGGPYADNVDNLVLYYQSLKAGG